MKNIEVQIGQIAQEFHRRPQGGLPSGIMANSKGKEQCHAVTLKNGKQVYNPRPKKPKESRIREEVVYEQQELEMKEDDLNSKNAKSKLEEQNKESAEDELRNE